LGRNIVRIVIRGGVNPGGLKHIGIFVSGNSRNSHTLYTSGKSKKNLYEIELLVVPAANIDRSALTVLTVDKDVPNGSIIS
jgi:hypothetical protein